MANPELVAEIATAYTQDLESLGPYYVAPGEAAWLSWYYATLPARTAELRNVKIRSCLSMKPRAVLEADPNGEHYFWFSGHSSGCDRRKHDEGVAHYISSQSR